MAYGKCPWSNETCKYYNAEPVVKGENNGCRTNLHHIFRRAEAKALGKVAQQFCDLPINRVNVCQAAHEDYEANYGWPDYPDPDTMREVIER